MTIYSVVVHSHLEHFPWQSLAHGAGILSHPFGSLRCGIATLLSRARASIHPGAISGVYHADDW